MTGQFDTVIVVDWSGGNQGSAKPRADAIWACIARGEIVEEAVYLRHRGAAEDWLIQTLTAETTAGRRVFVGFDFPFGYPAGFGQALLGSDDPFDLWDWFEARIEDTPTANNRFDVAGQINTQFGGRGPFWGNGLKRDIAGLPRTKLGYANPFPDRRKAEEQATGAFTLWQMSGVGSVGGQVMMGLPVLNRLRRHFGAHLAVWPFEPLKASIAVVEVWPSLTAGAAPADWIKDQWQVHAVARDIAALEPARLSEMLNVPTTTEGWIFGLGYEDELRGTGQPLRNDCFALPPGVHWTPVDVALQDLRKRLHPVMRAQPTPVDAALGRVLATDVVAPRANPPLPNTAVDGYGFAGGRGAGAHRLPLVDAQAAAGARLTEIVPPGAAVRILTGAALPDGVDTVVLQEDVDVIDGAIRFMGPLKAGANTRAAGEDVQVGDVVAEKGRRLTPADLAVISAVGVGKVSAFERLRVGVLSTGDELVGAGQDAAPGQIFDANRPMVMGLIERLGHVPIDLGRVEDNRPALRARLDEAAAQADVILTSGGASAGDEDHVSGLLNEAGAMALWRIAIKPGRPLALGVWQGKPVFGLPGNPVAAMVCTLVFAAPALAQMAGAAWTVPHGFDLPAAFEKRKKPGRREFLRARVRAGRVEVFASEGSGRISGLAWAEGLVELPDGAVHVQPGDPVRYIPWSGFMP
ncbi:molybdopterin-binding protein [Tateyamaria pelophila]|uniref:molybdopterin-binding protein n=1 Tax=Tateyamaria pelophila TaxID=328415 RepID=UPI001CBF691B|nr:gephyrin-like molybdotransferase Glp [Tateyamaria pelophila]